MNKQRKLMACSHWTILRPINDNLQKCSQWTETDKWPDKNTNGFLTILSADNLWYRHHLLARKYTLLNIMQKNHVPYDACPAGGGGRGRASVSLHQNQVGTSLALVFLWTNWLDCLSQYRISCIVLFRSCRKYLNLWFKIRNWQPSFANNMQKNFGTKISISKKF